MLENYAMTAKNRITVNLGDDEYKALQQIASRTDRSLAWWARKAIKELIGKKELAQVVAASGQHDTNQEAKSAQ
jgi:predicted transcriptional regulator